MTGRGQDVGRAALVALIAVAADQITKAVARSEIEPGESVDLIAGVELVRVSNDGIAFGLLGGAGPLVIGLGAAAFTLLLAYFLATNDREGLWLPIGLIAGGAIGNLIDRVAEGAVTDFIDPPNWPAFNVADIEITAGVLLLGLLYLRDPEPDDGSEPEVAPEAEAAPREGEGR